jgi:cobalt-zinc-cadmium efflux system membrane fusion protein
VVAPVTGRVRRPPRVQLGDAVRAGATIVDLVPALDTPDRIAVGTEAAVRAGDIEAAERDLARAQADAARARELSPQVVSAAQLLQAETAVATARARLDGLRQARAAAVQARTQPVPVAAPMAGVVSALSVQVGAVVNKGDVLARVIVPGPLWVDVLVPPGDPAGDAYSIGAPSGPVAARLLARGRFVEADGTRHDRLVVDARSAGALMPGSSVSVRVAYGTARGIVLPEAALVPRVEGDMVFVERSPGVFAPRSVEVATRFGGRMRLRSGVTAGERVVVQGVMALQGERLRSQLQNAEQ